MVWTGVINAVVCSEEQHPSLSKTGSVDMVLKREMYCSNDKLTSTSYPLLLDFGRQLELADKCCLSLVILCKNMMFRQKTMGKWSFKVTDL